MNWKKIVLFLASIIIATKFVKLILYKPWLVLLSWLSIILYTLSNHHKVIASWILDGLIILLIDFIVIVSCGVYHFFLDMLKPLLYISEIIVQLFKLF